MLFPRKGRRSILSSDGTQMNGNNYRISKKIMTKKKSFQSSIFIFLENRESVLKGVMCLNTFLHHSAIPLNPVVHLICSQCTSSRLKASLLSSPPPIRAIIGKRRTEQTGVFELCGRGWLWHTGRHPLRQKHCSHEGASFTQCMCYRLTLIDYTVHRVFHRKHKQTYEYAQSPPACSLLSPALQLWVSLTSGYCVNQ